MIALPAELQDATKALREQIDAYLRSADQEALDARRAFVTRRQRVRGAGTAEQDDREKARPDLTHGAGFDHSSGGKVKRDAQ